MSTSSNMVLIETKTVGSGGSASIDFTGIPQTGYTDLQIVIAARSTRVSPSDYPRIKFNGLTTNQSMRQLYGTGSGVGSTSESTIFGQMTAANATANTFGNTTFYIPNYTGSTYKSVSIDGVMENNATASDSLIAAGLWSSTAAITDISFVSLNGANFVEGSTASLYGIKSLNKNVGPKATGGIITTAGGYAIHTFYSSGTFTPTQDLTNVEYLVIAGGGAGGATAGTSDQGSGGGGGAGGYRSSVTGESSGGGASAESKLSLTSGTGYTVTVGAGGASVTTGRGTQGGNSVFSTITSTGGAGGGGQDIAAGGTGGSGGGSFGGSTAGGAGTSGQGYAGGASSTDSATYTAGGGGGGASAVGQNGVSNKGGNGGAGLSSNITGTSVARAGGGGGVSNTGSQGTGGTGGGGNAGVSGVSNTGGGGGGELYAVGGYVSGAGGSGIVIVRYAL